MPYSISSISKIRAMLLESWKCVMTTQSLLCCDVRTAHRTVMPQHRATSA